MIATTGSFLKSHTQTIWYNTAVNSIPLSASLWESTMQLGDALLKLLTKSTTYSHTTRFHSTSFVKLLLIGRNKQAPNDYCTLADASVFPLKLKRSIRFDSIHYVLFCVHASFLVHRWCPMPQSWYFVTFPKVLICSYK